MGENLMLLQFYKDVPNQVFFEYHFLFFNNSESLIPVTELSFFRDKPENSLFSFKNCPNSGMCSPLLKKYSIDAA
ncbi:hypothetical protein ROI_11990 [Roseburia intestinalis M50/1]|nr:hypothetical protein ROI_11990 [Roseburia intestinalis M50/1]